MTDGDALKLEYKANCKGAGTLTARCGEQVLHVDQLDVRKASKRTAFIDMLCIGLPGINRPKVEDELLRLAGDTVKAGTPQETEATELDAQAAIVRPELFHKAGVSGVCVPSPVSNSPSNCGLSLPISRSFLTLSPSLSLSLPLFLLIFTTPPSQTPPPPVLQGALHVGPQ